MYDQASTLEKLSQYRYEFWFTLGGYALLTEEPTRSILTDCKIAFDNNSLQVALSGAKLDEPRGTRYGVEFGGPIESGAALRVVNRSFRSMIIESFEVTRLFGEKNGFKHELKHQDWYWFAYYVRNALAHGNVWEFKYPEKLPVTWRNLVIDESLDGKPMGQFLGWYDGMQLCAVMNLFVTNPKGN